MITNLLMLGLPFLLMILTLVVIFTAHDQDVRNKSVYRILSVFIQISYLAIACRLSVDPPAQWPVLFIIMILITAGFIFNYLVVIPSIIIAIGISLLLAIQPVSADDPIFAIEILPADQPAVTRTCPYDQCAKTGDIWQGVFTLETGPFVYRGREWWEISISQFSDKTVYLEIDYDRMRTVFIKRQIFYAPEAK